jgi:tetratricopeptide (TPR) repeat protein
MRLSLLLCCFSLAAVSQQAEKQTLTAAYLMGLTHKTNQQNLEKIMKWLHQQPPSVGDSGIILALKAATMARELNKPNEEALAYYEHATILIDQGKEKQVIPILNKASTIKGNITDSVWVKISYTRGLALYNLDSFKQSIDTQEKTIALAKKIDYKSAWANALNNMAGSYHRLSNFSKALASYLEALQLYQATNDNSRTALVLGNIGLTYKYLEQTDKAIDYTQRAIEKYEQIGDTARTSDLWMKIGNIKDLEGNRSEALKYLYKSLQLAKRYNQNNTKAYATCNIGVVYTYLKTADSAWKYLTLGESYLNEINDQYSLPIIKINKARLILSASSSWLATQGLSQSLAIQETLRLIQESNAMSKNYEDIYGLAEGTELEMALWEKSMNTAKALDAAKRLLVLKDTLNSDESREEIVRAEMKYAQQQQEAVMKAKFEGELRVQRQVRITTISVAILVLLGTGTFFVQFKKRQAEKRIQLMAEFNAAVAETEMKALRSQMNPHFIFNALNSIADYIRKNESAIADAYLTKFARLIRMVLENSAQKEITLQSELETLQLYLELEAMRMQHKFSFSIDVAPSINRQTTEVPPLLLQPFVENSIWHGIAPKKDPGHIAIKIVPGVSQQIVCLIEDNGVGLRTEPFLVNPKKSMGLDITQQRLELIQRRTGIDAGFELKPALQGVLASIRIPVLS